MENENKQEETTAGIDETTENTAAEETETPSEETDASAKEPETAPEEEAAEEVSPEDEITELKKKLEEEQERYKRLDAEYYNYRTRSVKEKSEAYENALADAVTEILSVIDNFERALSAECSDAGFKKGVEMIFEQYRKIIEKLGVTEIDAVGKPFDPNLHNAVSSIEDENLGDNTVAAVLQKGYMIGKRVIRHAMVTVANP